METKQIRKIKLRQTRKTLVGLLIIAAILIVMYSIQQISSHEGLFAPKYELRTRMSQIGGLAQGGQVQFAGVQVGNVSDIAFITADNGSTKVEICLLYTSPSPRDRTRSRMPSSA